MFFLPDLLPGFAGVIFTVSEMILFPGWHRDYAQATNDMGNAAIPRLLVKCAYYLTDLTGRR